MSDKILNIISNFIGIFIIIYSTIAYIKGGVELLGLVLLIIIGSIFFFFKSTQTKKFIGKFLNKEIDKIK